MVPKCSLSLSGGAEVHRLSRKITEREPFHMNDLGALKTGGKCGGVCSKGNGGRQEGELIELVQKLLSIGLCICVQGLEFYVGC